MKVRQRKRTKDVFNSFDGQNKQQGRKRELVQHITLQHNWVISDFTSAGCIMFKQRQGKTQTSLTDTGEEFNNKELSHYPVHNLQCTEGNTV